MESNCEALDIYRLGMSSDDFARGRRGGSRGKGGGGGVRVERWV